jgi:hypothetical protein
LKWVKGHQDERTPYKKLSHAAKLNLDCDQRASEHYWSGKDIKPSSTTPHLHEHKVTIAINGVIYPSKIDQQICYYINGTYLKDQLLKQFEWNDATWNIIDITAFGRHFKTLNPASRVQQMKFVYNLQPLRVQQSKMEQSTQWLHQR